MNEVSKTSKITEFFYFFNFFCFFQEYNYIICQFPFLPPDLPIYLYFSNPCFFPVNCKIIEFHYNCGCVTILPLVIELPRVLKT